MGLSGQKFDFSLRELSCLNARFYKAFSGRVGTATHVIADFGEARQEAGCPVPSGHRFEGQADQPTKRVKRTGLCTA